MQRNPQSVISEVCWKYNLGDVLIESLPNGITLKGKISERIAAHSGVIAVVKAFTLPTGRWRDGDFSPIMR
jgi:hypothetical protein